MKKGQKNEIENPVEIDRCNDSATPFMLRINVVIFLLSILNLKSVIAFDLVPPSRLFSSANITSSTTIVVIIIVGGTSDSYPPPSTVMGMKIGIK